MAQASDEWLAQAVACQNGGDLDGAQTLYWRILFDEPRHFNALHLLGVSKCQQGRHAEGAWFIALALEQRDEGVARYNLGMAYADLHRTAEAIEQFDRALALKPDHVQAYVSRGDALQVERRYPEAIASYEAALAIQPTLANALSNLGAALVAEGEVERAIGLFHQAMAHGATKSNVLLHLGRAQQELGQMAAARASFEAAYAERPDSAQAHWFAATAMLPNVPASVSEVDASRPSLLEGLDAVEAWYAADSDGKLDRLEHDWPFYLAYQERNNRAIMARFGQARARLVGEWAAGRNLPPVTPNREGRVRVAVVSGHIYNHSVWQAITHGWFVHFDPAKIELHAFFTARRADAATDAARKLAAHFTDGVRSPEDWMRAIIAARPEVIIYPAIGMEGLAANLAALRLAPVQLNTWGHPDTSGMPTIDGYISAEAFESPGSEAAYTEPLIALPRFGASYTPSRIAFAEPDLAALGLDPSRPLLLCPGSPFKYAPEADAALAAVARGVGDGQLVFFHAKNNSPMSHRLEARLAARFAAEGLRFADHVRFIPFQKLALFHGLLRRADLVLDTIGFSGFNIAMQVLGNGTPMVAYEGKFMRGRLASGIVRTLGLHELVATSHAEYAAIATRLAKDADWRAAMRQKIAAGMPGIYNDRAAVLVLQDAILQMAERARGA